MKYRSEIDGLRAIAVLAVVLFHAGFSGFSGGFLGVDVFFVISGYLITTIILDKIEIGDFSLIDFYMRRTRRIIPVLFFVILIFIPIFWYIMLPWDFENFGAEVVATVLFSNNIFHFITSGNYWATESEFKALLHTWSLGVEEQFYLFFPILTIFITRIRKNWLAGCLIILCCISFAVPFIDVNPMATFFLLPFRIWELLAGSLIALKIIPKIKNYLIQDVFSVLGLLMLAFGIFLTDKSSAGSGASSTVVILGTMLIILFATGGTYVAKILSLKPLVWIGMISFSLYLWHQPIFVSFRLLSISEPEPFSYIPYIILSVFLSIFSWKYIETPFRHHNIIRNKVFVSGIASCSVLLIFFGYTVFSSGGLPSRWDSYNLEHTKTIKNSNVEFNNSVIRKYGGLAFPQNTSENVLVIGNSFARDFLNAGLINNYFSKYNLSYTDYKIKSCINTNNFKDSDSKFVSLLKDADHIIFASGIFESQCSRKDIEFLSSINNASIVFIGTKNFGWSTTANLFLREVSGNDARVSVIKRVKRESDELKSKLNSELYVDTLDLLVDKQGSVNISNEEGKLLSFDTRHLTPAGATYLGKLWFKHSLLEKFKK